MVPPRPTSPVPSRVRGAVRGRTGGALALVTLVAACGTTHGATPATTTTPPVASTTVPVPSTTAPAATASWTTYGGTASRSSFDASFPAVTRAPVSAWTSTTLDGAVYGEPLIDDGEVLVATENDTVYALSAASGMIRWSVHLATPAPAGGLLCGDIEPTVGITSTMVIDPATGTVYASAETEAGGSVHHDVFAIDIATHTVTWSRAVDQPGWTAAAQLQRTGLGLSGGHVLVGFGGNYGDCGRYHGWVVGVPETGSGPLLTYQVPTAREGAVWAPAGVAVDGAGHVFAATGNGSAGAGQAFDHGNAVIELSPSLAELSYFAPRNWAQDNAADADLGSTAPVLLDNGQIFIVGKGATAYLLDGSHLGGIGGQEASLTVCASLGGNAYQAPDVYVVCPEAGEIVQVRIGGSRTLSRGWTWTSPTGSTDSPTIAGGVVWTVEPNAQTLEGIDEANGTSRFSLPLDVGTPEHFSAPSAAGGMLVVAGSRAVEAFR